MIKLYFLELESGLVKAGFTHNGKRCLSPVSSQGGAWYVETGAAVTNSRERHSLSKAQSSAVDDFIASKSFAVDYAAPIL